MTVYIVIVNGTIDAVFDNKDAAELHRKNKQVQWSLTSIVEKPLLSL
jgi:hypothetical protein